MHLSKSINTYPQQLEVTIEEWNCELCVTIQAPEHMVGHNVLYPIHSGDTQYITFETLLLNACSNNQLSKTEKLSLLKTLKSSITKIEKDII